ncbi:hypothetical protein C0995_004578 [Termitomyces sp. Mi166|nr:hypothetical protein C0995_004578 [Termitomyces sp. Mi166\
MGPTGNTTLLDFQQPVLAWDSIPINGLRLSAASPGSGAPPPSAYGSAYGLPLFSAGYAALLPRPPPGPPGSSPFSWLPGGPPLDGGALGGFPPGGWGPAVGAFPSQGGARNHYYYYYNASAPAQNNNDQDDSDGMHEALACQGQLDIQKPEPFSRHNP